MYTEAYLDLSRTSTVEFFLKKSHKNVIKDVRLGSKWASSIGFIVEKIYRMLILI